MGPSSCSQAPRSRWAHPTTHTPPGQGGPHPTAHTPPDQGGPFSCADASTDLGGPIQLPTRPQFKMVPNPLLAYSQVKAALKSWWAHPAAHTPPGTTGQGGPIPHLTQPQSQGGLHPAAHALRSVGPSSSSHVPKSRWAPFNCSHSYKMHFSLFMGGGGVTGRTRCSDQCQIPGPNERQVLVVKLFKRGVSENPKKRSRP